jgi:choline dehydrogenase
VSTLSNEPHLQSADGCPDTPAYSYFDSLWPTPLNWGFKTVAQPNADDRQLVWPRGKTLGGSSAINGLYLNRPGEFEIEAWHDMLGDMHGANHWSWQSFMEAMEKSETFEPALDYIATQSGIESDTAGRGDRGPIHASYPGWMVPQNGAWQLSLQNMDVASPRDTYDGDNCGGYISTSTINPSNWTRSYSRTGYLDPYMGRENYDVVVDAHVTRLIFDSKSPKDNLTATGVEYTIDNGITTSVVKANKEIILSSGTVGSPAVLMHSGIGPRGVLDAAGVDVVIDLPGVGQHLQDHLLATVYWNSSQKTAGAIWIDDEDPQRNDTMFLSFINDAVAYVNASRIFGKDLDKFASSTKSDLSNSQPLEALDKTVVAGYKAITNTTMSTLHMSDLGQVELLLVTSELDSSVGITAALQHPYSHGAITIATSNPLDYPLINPNYLSHPSDVALLREGLKLARQLGETAPLSEGLTGELAPGPGVQSDEDWEKWMRQHVNTEYHPSSTCAMLPRDQGGVVDAQLRVYGTGNVRVVDASIPPIAFSAHLVGSTYGIAETGADIIRKWWNLPRKQKDDSEGDDTDDDQDGDDKPKNPGNGGSTGESGSTTGSETHDNAASSLPSTGFATFVLAWSFYALVS